MIWANWHSNCRHVRPVPCWRIPPPLPFRLVWKSEQREVEPCPMLDMSEYSFEILTKNRIIFGNEHQIIGVAGTPCELLQHSHV